MDRPLLIFEDLHKTPRRKLFTLFGVEWLATPYAWLSPPFFCLLGIAAALLDHTESSLTMCMLMGVIYSLLLYACNTIYSLGHILGGTILGAPMNALLVTGTRDVTVYIGSRAEVPLRIRMGRAVSGPLLNLLAGFLAVLFGRMLHVSWLTVFGYFNLGVGIWTLCPIPTMDGWVIWEGLLRRGNKPRP